MPGRQRASPRAEKVKPLSAAEPKDQPPPKSTGARRKSRRADASSVDQDFETTLDLIPALAWRARPDGFAEYLNRRWLDYTGVSLDQALGWQWLALIHPDDAPGLQDAWPKVIGSGRAGEAEARMRRYDGVYRWFLFRAVPSRDDAGAIVAWYGINTDIDELRATEFALRQSKAMLANAARLQETLDSIPTLAWRAEANGFREFLNRRWLDYTGLTQQEALGWEWLNAIHPDDRTGLVAAWRGLLAVPQPSEIEVRLRRFDGTYRWFLLRSQPVRDDAGALIAWYGADDDIEDRRRAETELRINEQRYRELFNCTPVGLLEIDARKRTEMLEDLHRRGVTNIDSYLTANPDFENRAIHASIIKHVNPRTVEMLGAREAEELIGLSTARLLTMSADALRRGTVSRFRGEKLFEHEIKVETLDGRKIDVLMTVARPDVSRNFLALTDITKRKAAEKALRESEQRYRQLFEFVPVAIWQVDLSGIGELMDGLRAEGVTDLGEHLAQQPDALDRMMDMLIAVDVNESAVKMFAARDRSELIGPCWFHWKANPESFRHAMGALFRGEDLFQEEAVFTALDGRKINALFAMSRGIVGIVDVTDRTRALERFHRLQAEFARGARISMLGELAASIAHEVNQPLAAIQIRSSTALRWLDRPEPDVAKLRELAQRNVEDAHRAADIVARIRTMAAGRTPERAKLSLHEVIEEALVFLRNELESNAVSVTRDLVFMPPMVIGDRIQLQQVVVNLIVNAMQAMALSADERRKLLIRTRLPEATNLCCTFEDSGPGIDPPHLDRLFDNFFTTKDTGMGMGLPVSRSIVEAHGGVLQADNNSELGGARFSFSLPVCE